MFPGEKPGEWEPHKIRAKKADKPLTTLAVADGTSADTEQETLYEDFDSDEGAVYPMRWGIVNDWDCFCALLQHIHKTLGPPLHTPILLVTPSVWAQPSYLRVVKFIFQTFQPPAFAILDEAKAILGGFKATTALIVDVGWEKFDITPIDEHHIVHPARKLGKPFGGENMTRRLWKLLQPKGFTRDMCEQLKKSPICEILPEPSHYSGQSNGTATNADNVTSSRSKQQGSIPGPSAAPKIPAAAAELGDDITKSTEDDEGILDVAGIIGSGKTEEFLAKKEREKAEKAAAKKTHAETAAAAKPIKLPNSQRATIIFHYDAFEILEEESGDSATAAATNGEQVNPSATTQEAASSSSTQVIYPRKSRAVTLRKSIEVGPERFEALDEWYLNYLCDCIDRAIHDVEPKSRAMLWDNIIIVGNGSKVKGTGDLSCSRLGINVKVDESPGFKEAVIAKLNAVYLVTSHANSIPTSEIPSNLSTPLATGANTPQPQSQSGHHGTGVNPLLLAATTASNPTLAPPVQHNLLQAPQWQLQNPLYPQTPTSITLLKMPDYFGEWKDAGSEEVAMLGAQVAANVLFIAENGNTGLYMSRTDWNELGPKHILRNIF